MPIKVGQLVQHSILGVGYVGDHDSAVNFNNASYIFIYTTKIKYKQLIRIKQEGDRQHYIHQRIRKLFMHCFKVHTISQFSTFQQQYLKSVQLRRFLV